MKQVMTRQVMRRGWGNDRGLRPTGLRLRHLNGFLATDARVLARAHGRSRVAVVVLRRAERRHLCRRYRCYRHCVRRRPSAVVAPRRVAAAGRLVALRREPPSKTSRSLPAPIRDVRDAAGRGEPKRAGRAVLRRPPLQHRAARRVELQLTTVLEVPSLALGRARLLRAGAAAWRPSSSDSVNSSSAC